MSNEKSREEFEAYIQSTEKHSDLMLVRADVESRAYGIELEDGDYLNEGTRQRWADWQASRAALVIELPSIGPTPEPPEDAFDDSYLDGHHAAIRMRNRCYLAIETAGAKVKS